MIRTPIILAAGLALATAAALAAGPHASGHAHHEAAPQRIGQPGVAAQVTRTIPVDMDDHMRFTPADIRVRQGETVRLRLRVRNVGALPHELVLGTEEDLRAHEKAMQQQPQMRHAEANMVTLAAGKTGEIVWRFTQAGRVDFGCLQPGHYGAGMKGVVHVAEGGRK